jgi:Putative adhesin
MNPSHLPRLVTPAVLLLISASVAHAAIERNIEKSFTVPGDVELYVSTEGGDVKVLPATDGKVTVIAHERIKASSEAEANALLERLKLEIEQEGRTVTAKANYDEGHFHIGFFWNWPPVQVDFKVLVPADTSAKVHTSGGDVYVDGIKGKVSAHTSGGNLRLGKLGGRVEASTSGGNVDLEEASSPVDLSTAGGNIHAGRTAARSSLHTSGGDIVIDEALGPVDAGTSGGDVRVGFAGPIKGDSVLKTSGGTVKATVAQSASLHIEAHTSGGSVRVSGLDLRIAKKTDETLVADAGAPGGSLLEMRTSGGDIELVSRRD